MANEKLRFNRAGTSTAPSVFPALTDDTSPPPPQAPGDDETAAHLRPAYDTDAAPSLRVRQTSAGSPRTRAKEALALNGGVVFRDQLGDRLAFERAGIHHYDLLLAKHDAWGTWAGGPRRAQLETMRAEEQEHFVLLQQVLGELGADAAAVRPSATAGVISRRLADAQANLREGLEAIRDAELVENDGWEDLSDLASALGRDDLATRFEAALAQERDHLSLVRRWLEAATRALAGSHVASPAVGAGAAGAAQIRADAPRTRNGKKPPIGPRKTGKSGGRR